SDADETKTACRAHYLCAGAQPHMMAACVLNAENLIEIALIACADRACKFIKIALVRAQQSCSFTKGKRTLTRGKPQNLVQRVRPGHRPAVEVKIPQAATSARKCRFNAHIGFGRNAFRFTSTAKLRVIKIKKA